VADRPFRGNRLVSAEGTAIAADARYVFAPHRQGLRDMGVACTLAPIRTGPARGAMRKTQIVIVGGGAGGLELATRLGRRFGRKRHDIILVERGRTHIWKPLLHEVATGSLDANLDEVGYRSHGHRWGYRYFFGTLAAIDRE